MSDAANDSWEAAIDIGAKAFNQTRYSEAEAQFKHAYEVAQQWEPCDLRRLWSFDWLALVYRVQGKDEETEALRQHAREISERLGEQAKELRQKATSGTELEHALTVQGSSVFYGRRWKWVGRGTAESFANAFPGLNLNIQFQSVWVGNHKAMARGDYSSSAVDGNAIVESGPGWILLRLMGRDGDDVQLSLNPEECEALIEALRQAAGHAREN